MEELLRDTTAIQGRQAGRILIAGSGVGLRAGGSNVCQQRS